MSYTIASRLTALLVVFLLCSLSTFAQPRTITGRVTDQDGKGVPGVTVSVRGTSAGVQTSEDGTYRITVTSDSAVLVFSSVGFATKEIDATGQESVSTSLISQNANLSEVVVIGYGTARRKDITGSVATVGARDFNKGVQLAPDQLIQGKVPGVQILNNSGMPGGETTVRIRGAASIRAGNQPLFVLDGVILDNASAKPGAGNTVPQIGDRIPGTNPLNFLNPTDIASIDVLKDASATAIYGSRGANGVILITTKKGTGAVPRIDFNASVGFSDVMKRLEVLDASEYRAALQQYNTSANDLKSDVDAFDEITRTGVTQTYSIGVGGGTDVARYRMSLGYMDQEGIVNKTGLKKYTAYLNGGFRFLESKRLGLDVTVIGTQLIDNTAPISQNAGFEGSLIGQALQWNPTKPLRNPDGSLNVDQGGSVFNPLAVSEAYNDESKVSSILAVINPSFKITNDLEYRMIGSVNYSEGDRKQWIANFINFREIQRTVDPVTGAVTNLGGAARIANQELISRQITHTLNYNKDLSKALFLNALVGYEYLKSDTRNNDVSGTDFPDIDYPYYDYFQSTDPTRLQHGFFVAPTTELQSFFGRAQVNLNDKYIVTATLRADGSSKFGKNNRYGYFPSFAGAWNITSEDFFNVNFINSLKLRLGWGKTGNQEFPAGASQRRYALGFGTVSRVQLENPDLKWETSTTTNAGVDFSIWNNRVTGVIDWFRKVSSDILFLADAPDPAIAGGRRWINLDGEVINSGVELAFNMNLIRKQDFTWDFGLNATYLHNELTGLIAPLETGEISGQGLSETRSQLFTNNQPLNVFYLKQFQGIDKGTGIGVIPEERAFSGNPNPDVLLGISTRANYGKFGLEINMNGAFGHQIYNNTANALLTVNNVGIGRNTTAEAVSAGESLASPIAASTRYLEDGDYLKLANATLSYRFGNLKAFKNATLYLTGQNLFVITSYTGFDPEVNTNKIFQELPSFGIEYTPYPTARTITIGASFSF